MMDISQIAKAIRKQLKAEFPACKFSVRLDRYSMGQSLAVSLMTAPFEVFADSSEDRDYAQLNPFQLRGNADDWDYICNGTCLTREVWMVMKRVDEIQRGYNWDNSDSMTDYFDVNFYFHPEIGQWNKPFQVSA